MRQPALFILYALLWKVDSYCRNITIHMDFANYFTMEVVMGDGFENYVRFDHIVYAPHGRAPSLMDEPVPLQSRHASTNDEGVRLREEIFEVCYDYKARNKDELSLRRGSRVRVVKGVGNGWVKGVVDGEEGLLPSNYFRPVGKLSCVQIDPREIEILSLIGEGAAGHVHRAKYSGQIVAFKRFKLLGREGESTVIERAIDAVKLEATYFNSLKHVNIVGLLGVCLTEPMIGLVLELCQGGSLSQVYKRVADAAVPKRIIVDWAIQIAEAMEEISKHFVHRDLKMDNVLVKQSVCFCALPNSATPDRPNSDLYSHDDIQANGECRRCKGTAFDRLQLKLTDFGLTRENSLEGRVSSTTAGTWAWIAPEAYMKQEYSEFSDVWSFGVVMWELVTRKQPYDGYDEKTIPFFVASSVIELPITKEFPTAISILIKSCLQKDAKQRPRFSQIKMTLLEYLDELHAVNDTADYVERRALEQQLCDDLKSFFLTQSAKGLSEGELKKFEDEIKKQIAYSQTVIPPEPPERGEVKKKRNKVDKFNIGPPQNPTHVGHVGPAGGGGSDFFDGGNTEGAPAGGRASPSFGGTLGRPSSSMQPLSSKTLSRSQPNLNQVVAAAGQSISRERNQGFRKKTRISNGESSSIHQYLLDAHPTYGDNETTTPFSNSYNGTNSTTESDGNFRSRTGSSDKRPSEGSVVVREGAKKEKEKKKFVSIAKFKDFLTRAPRSSASIDSEEDVHSNRSHSVSSVMTSSTNAALLYNLSKTPIAVSLLVGSDGSGRGGGRSPEQNRHNADPAMAYDHKHRCVQPTDQTKKYVRSPASSSGTPGANSYTGTPSSSSSSSAYSALVPPRPTALQHLPVHGGPMIPPSPTARPSPSGSASSSSGTLPSAAACSSSEYFAAPPSGPYSLLSDTHPSLHSTLHPPLIPPPPLPSPSSSFHPFSSHPPPVYGNSHPPPLPPKLPPRRLPDGSTRESGETVSHDHPPMPPPLSSHGHHTLSSELSMVVPLDQSSPVDLPAGSIFKHRSRTLSSSTLDSPSNYDTLATDNLYMRLPGNAAVASAHKGRQNNNHNQELEADRDSAMEEFVCNPFYAPYQRMDTLPNPPPGPPPVLPPKNC